MPKGHKKEWRKGGPGRKTDKVRGRRKRRRSTLVPLALEYTEYQMGGKPSLESYRAKAVSKVMVQLRKRSEEDIPRT